MSNQESDTKLAETSQQQQRYNTRKRKASEDKDVVKEKAREILEKSETKKLKPTNDDEVEIVEESELKKSRPAKEEEEEEEVILEKFDEEEDEVVEVKNGVPEGQVEEEEDEEEEEEAIIVEDEKKEDNAEGIITRSRKRKLPDDVEEKEDAVKPETSKKRKEIEEEEKVEVIYKFDPKRRRITRNECFCAPYQRKPDYSTDKDAEITVENWRLQSVQSPIALKHEDSNEYDYFAPLEFHGHWDNEGDATITNNGFTATLMFKNREVPFLLGGPLHEDTYIFEQLHFHWSNDDHSGCEHIFEGKAYSMEAHAVHYNSKYESFKDAVDKQDGLTVVAFFLQATDDFENECFNKLSEAVKDIVKINSSTQVRPDCLTWIKKEAQCKGYYTYQGSLTTEPYFESVTWIIYPKPIHISREQVQSFRNMKSTPCEQHNILNNVRPLQTPQKKLDIIYARSHKSSE